MARPPMSDPSLRVCILVAYDLAAVGGGVKQHAIHLADALRRRGDQVHVIGPMSAPLPDPQMTGFRGVVNVPSNGSDNFIGIWTRPWDVRRFLAHHQFDVVHVHEPIQPTLSYLTVWQTPRTAHVATFHAFMEQESDALRRARRFFGAMLLPFFQRGIAVSEPAHDYAQVVWKRPLAVIPNGVPTHIFTPPPPRPPEARARLLFVGRLGDPRKGVDVLLEAYRQLLARHAPVTLEMIGELGNATPPPALPGLTYHGVATFEELIRAYRECDVFVAPSTFGESFGIVLLEAMASGRPVVCSDIDGYRRVAVSSGARLVPPGDAAALAEAIAAVVADPASWPAMGEANRRRACEFDWDHVAEQVRGQYLEALAEVRAGRVWQGWREVRTILGL